MARLIEPHKPETVRDLKGGSLTIRPLKNVKYTGGLMTELSVRYQNDVSEYGHFSIIQFFDFVKNIPYKPDPKKQEFLQRPYYTLKQRGKGGDCDDKAICLGAYCVLASIPFRFVALGRKRDGRLHHVVIEILLGDLWVHLDATYSFNTIGKPMYDYPRHMIISEYHPK